MVSWYLYYTWKFSTTGKLPLIYEFKIKSYNCFKLVHLKNFYEMSKIALELPADLNQTLR